MPRYFLLTIVYFWVPIALMGLFLIGKLDPTAKKAFWVTIALLLPLAFAMEYVYLALDIWTFSEAMDPLLGLSLWGAPIEEFFFWFGGVFFILLLYLSFDSLFKKRSLHA